MEEEAAALAVAATYTGRLVGPLPPVPTLDGGGLGLCGSNRLVAVVVVTEVVVLRTGGGGLTNWVASVWGVAYSFSTAGIKSIASWLFDRRT